jgi:Ca-activated chloride channel family protein
VLTLANPWFLVLLPLPLLVHWLITPYRQPKSSLQVPFMNRLTALTGRSAQKGEPTPRRSLLQNAVRMLAWLAIVLACARPQWIEPPISRVLPTRDLLVAVDLSGSMETRDFLSTAGERIDRVTAVKEVLDDFFARREGDRVGLLAFGSAPFVLVPFTEDLDACRALLDEMQPRMAGPQTMIGDAIGKAITVFESSEIEDQVLIILTDGNDTGSLVPPVKAAGIAADRNIAIHVIGMGDPTSVGEEALDTKTLEDIAQATGGQFFLAQDREQLDRVYDELDRLSTRELETLSYRPVTDLYFWPLGSMLLLVLAYNLYMAVRQGLRDTGVTVTT